MNQFKKENKSNKDKLVDTIIRNRKILIICLAVLIVVLFVLGGVEMLRNNRTEKSILLTEELQQDYLSWLQTSDDDEKKEVLFEELMKSLELVKSDGFGDYPKMKALFLEGRIHFDREEWDDAAESFYLVYEQYSDSYLGSLSLMNASYCYETMGDIDKAIELLKKIIDEYTGKSADVPEAIFNLGRLSEQEGNDKEALDYYNQILEDHASSSWKNIAQNRAIYINTK